MSEDKGSAVDKPRIEAAVREILLAIGEDPDRDGLQDTPARVARAYEEFFSGLHADPADVLGTTFDIAHSEMVLVKDIPFYSTCEHHLVPFHGVAHVGYIPGADVCAPPPGAGAADHAGGGGTGGASKPAWRDRCD